jgi:serralysin
MPDTVPGDTSTAATISPGGSVDVTVETLGDHDWYKITLTAGTTYVFHTSSISGSNPDTFLTLRDAAGVSLASNDDGGDSTFSLISYTATASGTFYIDAGTFEDGSIGSYHLTAIVIPPAGADSVLASTATTASLAVTGGIAGNIETASDHDWYAISLAAGETYIFRTGGIVADGTVDTTLTLRNAAGTQLITNDDAGEGAYSALRFTATTAGTYYLDVGAFGTTTGAYTLTAFTTPPLTVYTNDQIATQLTNGYWGGASHHFNVAPGGTITVNFSAIGASAQTLALEALNLWTDVTGINFTSVASGAQITFADTQTGAFANASYSGGITTSGTVNIGTAWITSYGSTLNSYSFQTFVHEIGHVLGLGHGGNYNGNASYASDALYSNDSWVTTVMSYFDQTENSYFSGLGFTRQYTVSPMVADGVAVANLYGANTLTRTGGTTYGFNNTSGRAIYDATANPNVSYTVFDNGGVDTLDYSGFLQNQRINLNQEGFSDIGGRVGNVSVARGSVIENAIGGTGNDTLYGNAIDNTLNGGAGNDILIGYDGDDTLDGGSGANVLAGGNGNDTLIVTASGNELSGGAGNDTYILASRSDTIVEAVGGGTDEVRTANAIYDLNSALNVENLTFTDNTSHAGVGNALANTLVGGTGADELQGRDGADILRGGSGAANTLLGGDGDDLYFVTAAGDTIIELSNQGTDTIQTVLSTFTMRDNTEILQFVGVGNFSGVGSAGANTMIAGVGADFLNGNDGADILIGGSGADLLIGGSGADQFRYMGGESGYDRILDFTPGTDKIALSNLGFAHTATIAFIATGAPVATTANSTFLYDVNSGILSYDADGNGAGAAVQLAQLNTGLTLTTGDFIFV